MLTSRLGGNRLQFESVDPSKKMNHIISKSGIWVFRVRSYLITEQRTIGHYQDNICIQMHSLKYNVGQIKWDTVILTATASTFCHVNTHTHTTTINICIKHTHTCTHEHVHALLWYWIEDVALSSWSVCCFNTIQLVYHRYCFRLLCIFAMSFKWKYCSARLFLYWIHFMFFCYFGYEYRNRAQESHSVS